jgi:hypothetical protein
MPSPTPSQREASQFVQRRIAGHRLPAQHPSLMRPVVFGEALSAGTRLSLFAADKPDRFFTVAKFWIDKTSGVGLDLDTGVPSYHVDDEEGRTHLLIHLPVKANEHRWCLWRPDHAGFDSRPIFEGALIEEQTSSGKTL